MTPRERIVKSAMDVVLSRMNNDRERQEVVSRIKNQTQFLAVLDLFYDDPTLTRDERSVLILACLSVHCRESFEFIFELSNAKDVSPDTKVELVVRELTDCTEKLERLDKGNN